MQQDNSTLKHAYISAILLALVLFTLPYLVFTFYFNFIIEYRPIALIGLTVVLLSFYVLHLSRRRLSASALAHALAWLALIAACLNCYFNQSVSHASVAALIGTFAISVINSLRLQLIYILVTQIAVTCALALALDFTLELNRLRWLLVTLVGQLVILNGLRLLFKHVDQLLEQEHSLRLYAESAANSKSRFLANMSHEIRTPIGGVMGLLDMLADSSLTQQQKAQLQLARQSARLLSHIVDDILDFSKIEAGKVVIKKEAFCLDRFFEQTLAVIRPKLADNQNQLSFTKSWSSSAWVNGDETRLSQILLNLLSNANKFTEQGKIQVNAELTDQNNVYNLQVSVQDSGIGISAQQLAELFEPFHQLEQPTTKKIQGSGLGLVISRQLTELMGGQIKVRSESQQGSTFCISLPLEKTNKPKEDNQVLANHASPRLDLSVLLVEDNEINQLIVTDLLENLGCQVMLAVNGKQALAKLRKLGTDAVDLILMDCQMPEMDGYSATQAIRRGDAGPAWKAIPIIALTANALDEDKAKCLAAGMTDYLTKPVDKTLLRQTLQGFVQI